MPQKKITTPIPKLVTKLRTKFQGQTVSYEVKSLLERTISQLEAAEKGVIALERITIENPKKTKSLEGEQQTDN
jgi:hypothetical protein